MKSARAAVAQAAMLTVLAGCGGSAPGGNSETGSKLGEASRTDGSTPAAPSPQPRLEARSSPHRLTTPVSGEALVPETKGLLVIGGLDKSDVSVAGVTAFEPETGAARSAGELSQPLHDLAAVKLPSGILVFGGGAATTTSEVQRLVPGGAGEVVGKLPGPRSDLSAVAVDGVAYVLAGFDGERAIGEILRTRAGSGLQRVAELPIPVRYAAVLALGPTVYAIGGEETSGADTSAIQAFDTRTGRVSVVGHTAGPLAHASAVVLGGRAYILGGRLNGSTTDQILRFDPTTGTAAPAGRLPEPIQNAAAAVVGDVGYLVGGLSPEESTLSSVVAVRAVGAVS